MQVITPDMFIIQIQLKVLFFTALVMVTISACLTSLSNGRVPGLHQVPAKDQVISESLMLGQADWTECRDSQYGFSLRVPPDWQSTTAAGRCVQFQKGASELPQGVPEVDVFIHVSPARNPFPQGYPNSPGVQYRDRQYLMINSLPAVRAKFQSSGTELNWGVEYVVCKGNSVLSIYISQPTPEIEQLFDEVVRTLRW